MTFFVRDDILLHTGIDLAYQRQVEQVYRDLGDCVPDGPGRGGPRGVARQGPAELAAGAGDAPGVPGARAGADRGVAALSHG